MLKRISLFILLLAVSVGGVIGYVLDSSHDRNGDPIDFIPPDVAAVIRLGDLKHRYKAGEPSILSAAFRDVNLERLETRMPGAAVALNTLIFPANEILSEWMRYPLFRKLLGTDITIGIQLEGNGSNPDCIDLNTPLCRREWAECLLFVSKPESPVDLIPELLSLVPDAGTYPPEPYRGHTIFSVFMGDGLVLYTTAVGHFRIGAFSYLHLIEMIDTHVDQRHKSGWISDFQSSIRRLGGELNRAIYIDLDQWAHLTGLMRSFPPAWVYHLDNALREFEQVIHVTVRQNDRMIRTLSYGTGRKRMEGAGPKVTETPGSDFRELVPETTAAYVRMPLDQLLSVLEPVISSIDLEKWQQKMTRTTGVNSDVLAGCFGRSAGILVSVPRRYTSTTLGDMAMMVPVVHPEIIENVLYSLFSSKDAVISRPLEFTPADYKGIRITTLHWPDGGPIEPAYAVVGGVGILATRSRMIEMMIDTQADGAYLARNADFNALGVGLNEEEDYYAFVSPLLLSDGLKTFLKLSSEIPAIHDTEAGTAAVGTIRDAILPLMRGGCSYKIGASGLRITEGGVQYEQAVIVSP